MARRLLTYIILFAAGLGLGAYWLSRSGAPGIAGAVSVAEAMASDTVGYARAQAVRPFVFPDDHGPHPDFKNEWWYFTGNLAEADGRRFGYELTLFRFALAPPPSTPPDSASAWATRQLYMGHFAVTDVASERFFPVERFSRGGAGLAGAQAAPFRVWLEDWTVTEAPEGLPALRIQAMHDGTGVDLHLDPQKPHVLQGDRGLDQKGQGLGNASYYYSYTRLATTGTVTIEGTPHAVRGASWMDREWSTSALDDGQVGWDWFALQLSDGRDLMYYQLREADGQVSPSSDGVLVAADGTAEKLDHAAVRLTVQRTWTSPHSGGEYPAAWRLEVPDQGLALTVTPLVADQEMDVSVRYWEGAVRIEGTADGMPIDGYGYVELTGYGDKPII